MTSIHLAKVGGWFGCVCTLTGCPDWRVAQKASIAETIHYSVQFLSFDPGNEKNWDGRVDFYFDIGVVGQSETGGNRNRLPILKTQPYEVTTQTKNQLGISFDIPGSLIKDKVEALKQLDQHFLSIRPAEEFSLFANAFDEKNLNLAFIPSQGPVKITWVDEPRPGRWTKATGAQMTLTLQEVYDQPNLHPIAENTYRFWVERWWASSEYDYETWEIMLKAFEQALQAQHLPLSAQLDLALANSLKPLIENIARQTQIISRGNQTIGAIENQASSAAAFYLFKRIKPMEQKELTGLTLLTLKEKLAEILTTAKNQKLRSESKLRTLLKNNAARLQTQ